MTSPRLLLAVAAALSLCACAAVPGASAASSGPNVIRGSVQAPSLGPEINIPGDIVRLARAELAKGVREIPRGSDNAPEIALYRAALIPRARPAAWCAYFVSWVARRSGAPIGRGGAGIASAGGIEAWAQRNGRWTHSPRPGDAAVFSGHAGIVVSVSGSRMTTIDGNWSDRVSLVQRGTGEALGFARIAVGNQPAGR